MDARGGYGAGRGVRDRGSAALGTARSRPNETPPPRRAVASSTPAVPASIPSNRPGAARQPVQAAAAAAAAPAAAAPAAAGKADAGAPQHPLVKVILWILFSICLLDMQHVWPHPFHQVEGGTGDDLAFALLGYPCHFNVTRNITQARITAEISEDVEKYQRWHEEATKAKKDALAMATARKLNATQARLKSGDLAKLNAAVLKAKDVCSPAPSLSVDWVVWQFQHAQPSWAVREWYTERLQDFADGLRLYRTGDKSASKKMEACELATVSFRLRQQIKLDARVKGSSLLHCLLIARDWYVYGYNVDLIKRKRDSLEKKGEHPTSEEVCNAVIDGSVRGNKAVTEFAKSMKYESAWMQYLYYPAETLLVHFVSAIPLVLCGWSLAFIASKLQAVFKNVFVYYAVVAIIHLVVLAYALWHQEVTDYGFWLSSAVALCFLMVAFYHATR